jgi:hypothetical protein
MNELETPGVRAVSRQHLIETFAGLALLVLAFFAIASSDVSATGTRTYWTLLI